MSKEIKERKDQDFGLEEKKIQEIKRMVSTLLQIDLTGLQLMNGHADVLSTYLNLVKKDMGKNGGQRAG